MADVWLKENEKEGEISQVQNKINPNKILSMHKTILTADLLNTAFACVSGVARRKLVPCM